jgi:transcriptional regulator with XRE-family HTH domain
MGKSQIEVAKAVGISNAALSNYETGYREPDLDTLCALARYYELTLDELVNVTNEQPERICDISTVVKDKHIKFKGEKNRKRRFCCENWIQCLKSFNDLV